MLKKLTYLFLILSFFSCDKKESDAVEKKAQEYIIESYKKDITILYEFLYQAKGGNPKIPMQQIHFLNNCINEEVRLLQSNSTTKAKIMSVMYDNYIDSLYKVSYLKHAHRELKYNNIITDIGNDNASENKFYFISSRLIRHKNLLREFIFAYASRDYDLGRQALMTHITEDSINTIIKLKYEKNMSESFKPLSVILLNEKNSDTVLISSKKIEFNKITIVTKKLNKGKYIAKVHSVFVTKHGTEDIGPNFKFYFEIF